MAKASEGALNIMRFHAERGSNARWAAYQNKDLAVGDDDYVQFLSIDPDSDPPYQHPHYVDSGTRCVFVGYVNLETGEIEKKSRG